MATSLVTGLWVNPVVEDGLLAGLLVGKTAVLAQERQDIGMKSHKKKSNMSGTFLQHDFLGQMSWGNGNSASAIFHPPASHHSPPVCWNYLIDSSFQRV